MWESIKKQFESKKFRAMALAILTVLIAGVMEVQAWEIVVKEILAAIGLYMGVQGAADIGKEKPAAEK